MLESGKYTRKSELRDLPLIPSPGGFPPASRPSAHRPAGCGEAGAIVGLDREAAQRRLARPARSGPGRWCRKRCIGSSFSMPSIEVVVAAHAGIGQVGRAAGEDAVVGGRHMGVRADDDADAAVDEMRHRLLLAGRLGVEVDEDGVAAWPERAGRDLAARSRRRDRRELHEHAAHDVDDQHAAPLRASIERGAAPRRAGGILAGRISAVLALDEDQRLALVPGMVAERHGIGAGIEQLVADRLGDAEAAGGVLAVDDDAIEVPAGAEGGQVALNGLATRPADDITQKKNAHEVFSSDVATGRGRNTIVKTTKCQPGPDERKRCGATEPVECRSREPT